MRFLFLVPPIGYVQYPKCTANLHLVGVVIIQIWITLSPVLWCFGQRIRIEPGGGQYAGCAIASSGCCLSHIVRRQVFLIIAGQIIWIKGWLIGPWSQCRGDGIAARYHFEFIDWHTSMFGTVLIFHVLQKGLSVMCSVGCLALRIDIHSLVPSPKRSQLPERMENVCGHQKHSRGWSHLSVVFGKLLSSYLHCEEQVFLPSSLFPGQSSHQAIHVIEHVIVHCDNLMQCDWMPHRHPKGPISKWPQYCNDILDNRPFIQSCE